MMASFAKQESRRETAKVADHQRKRVIHQQEVDVCHSATGKFYLKLPARLLCPVNTNHICTSLIIPWQQPELTRKVCSLDVIHFEDL